MSSHLGQSIKHHVVLELKPSSAGSGPFPAIPSRIMPDGSSVLGFDAPVVITDVEWHYAHIAASPGTTQVFKLFTGASCVFQSSVVLGPDPSGGGSGGVSVTMTAGFVVSSTLSLGIEMRPGVLGGLEHAILRGYLAVP